MERAATLEDVRAEVLAPERLNAFVLSGFAGVALLIAVVGVAGVLAFSVSARTREFGVRLAIGSSPRHLLVGVLLEGMRNRSARNPCGRDRRLRVCQCRRVLFRQRCACQGRCRSSAAALVLVGAAVLASLMPAARASRIDVLQALRRSRCDASGERRWRAGNGFPMNNESTHSHGRFGCGPGVIFVVLQWFFWVVVPAVPAFGAEAEFIGLIGGVLCGLIVVVWWLLFSRAPWVDRFAALALIVAGGSR